MFTEEVQSVLETVQEMGQGVGARTHALRMQETCSKNTGHTEPKCLGVYFLSRHTSSDVAYAIINLWSCEDHGKILSLIHIPLKMRGNFTMKFYIVTAPLKSHTWKKHTYNWADFTQRTPSAGSGIASCWLGLWGHQSRSVCFSVILDLTRLSSKITDQHTKERKILQVKSIGGIIT